MFERKIQKHFELAEVRQKNKKLGRYLLH